MTRDGWGQRLDVARWLGPGLVMAATAIGASHLVLAPTAGAGFGYALLWLVPLTHLFKYPAFDFGPRYAVATGTSLLDGYARVPGPRGWALWVFLAGTVVQGFTVLAGVLGVSAVVLHAAVPALPVPAWAAALGALTVALLWTGRFDGLSALSKAMLIGLAFMTAVAFGATPPPAEAWKSLVTPALPEGSLVLAAAILGWMPTGLDVSVWHSLWALERRDAWAERAEIQADDDVGRKRVFGIARLDLGVGYGLSFVLATMFLILGVQVLRPTGTIPQGGDVAVTIARLYTDVLGDWALIPFLTAAFFGMWSSTYGVMDGFPRAFSGTVHRLRTLSGPDRPADSPAVGADRADGAGPVYWAFLLVCLLLALVEIVWLRDPVLLVTVAAVASFLLAPLTYALNHWCVTRYIPDPGLRPGPTLRWWSLIGILVVTAATTLFLVVQL
ncbi:MAG: Nramp family divalent metal transporter [Gemmatimonadota bacterium]|nr:Nramp family divalent metal transporter [Gemmatimonadota bacterium]